MSTKDAVHGISNINIWDESKKTSNKYSIVANVRLGSVKEYISIEYRYDNELLVSDPIRLQTSFCSNSDFVKSLDYSASPMLDSHSMF